MKKFLYILLFAIFACSPEDDYALLENQSTSPAPPESLNLESAPPLNRNTANLIYTETFENPNLDLNPDLSDFYLEEAANHSFKLDENIKRNGSTAGRFEINKSDPEIWGGNRTEMSQAQSTTQEEGWYGFSQYFPGTYISDSTGEVIGQWHDKEDVGETASRSPSNTLLTADNRIKWMARWDADKIMDSGFSDGLVYIDLGPIPKNKWIDWVIHIKFSHTNTGIVEVWKDGVKVIDRINMPNAYNDDNYPYFKFGVYKWKWGTAASQRIIYYDEVRIGNSNSSYDEVKPSSSQESVTSKPVTSEPVTSEPVTSEPVTSEPVPSEPVTSEPVPSEPVTSEPVTSEPVTPEPVTSEPVTSEPVTSEPVTSEPVPSEPVTSEPVPSEPVTSEPVPSEPETSEPVPSEPVTSEPVTSEPVTSEPVPSEPVPSEPVTSEPETAEPVTSEPVTSEPVTSEPETAEPVTSEVVPSEPVTPVNRYRHNRHRQNRYRHNWNRHNWNRQ